MIIVGKAAALVAAGVLAVAPAADTATVPKHIVSVTGSAAHGFAVGWSDGSATRTPTRGEATAECGEYGLRVERVACRVAVRTSYRWMARTRDALRWAP